MQAGMKSIIEHGMARLQTSYAAPAYSAGSATAGAPTTGAAGADFISR